MNTYRITCANGRSWVTSMNATLEEARAYFAGYEHIEEDSITGNETCSPVVSVEPV